MPEASFDRRYIGGYLLGGSMLLVGLFFVVSWLLPGEAPIRMLLFGLWYAVAGFGIIRKTVYGLVMFYMAVFNSLLAFFYPHSDNPLVHVVVLVWLGIPALAYFPLRENWLDANPRNRQPLIKQVSRPKYPSRALDDDEVKQVFEHLRQQREQRKAKEQKQ